jgi:TonB family protein
VHEAVSDILVDRARQAQGINRMLMFSLAGHAVLLATVIAMPTGWRSGRQADEAVVMSISLGGAPGPQTPGMTQESGRTVQAVAPPEARPNPAAAPMATTPEMVVPDPASKARPAPRTKAVEKPADRSTSRQPTTGAEARTGAAKADTGAAPIPFGGLSSSGGGGTGATLDVKNFCCPGYIQTMVQLIRSNWKPNQGADGTALVKFVILRDGRLANVELEKSSNNQMLDLESRRAVLMTRQLPPLPAQFTEPTLTVHLQFDYRR